MKIYSVEEIIQALFNGPNGADLKARMEERGKQQESRDDEQETLTND